MMLLWQKMYLILFCCYARVTWTFCKFVIKIVMSRSRSTTPARMLAFSCILVGSTYTSQFFGLRDLERLAQVCCRYVLREGASHTCLLLLDILAANEKSSHTIMKSLPVQDLMESEQFWNKITTVEVILWFI